MDSRVLSRLYSAHLEFKNHVFKTMEETYNLGTSESDSDGEDEVTVEVEPKQKVMPSKNGLTQVQIQDIKNVRF